MSIKRSDNRLELHPKPVQEWERKIVGGEYVDWDSTTEVDVFYATQPGLTASYKLNKYFWVNGTRYQYTQDGYRLSGGNTGGMQSLNYTVEATGNTVYIPALAGFSLVTVMFAGIVYDNSQIDLDNSGMLDAERIGGFYEGNYLTVLYK